LPRSRRLTRQLILFGGIAVIGALIAFMVYLQVEASQNNDFKRAFETIVVDTNSLTQQYTAEEDTWLPKDNNTMIQVIDQYLPRYDALIERAKALNTPERYKSAHDYLVSAIELERQSYQHFRNYLATQDQSEYEKSSELISQSLEQSINADAAIKAAG
jgi:CMP-N-acetylneuraminic acid synthetase